MSDQIQPTPRPEAIEKDIQRISAEILRQRRRQETTSASGKEVIREAVRSYTGQVTPKSPPPPPAVVQHPLPQYAADAPAEVKEKAEQLLEMAFQEGILKAARMAEEAGPFVLDVFHDALAGKLYEELKKRGVVE